MRMRTLVVLALLLIVACGEESRELATLEVANAMITRDGDIKVTGFVFVEPDGTAKLCQALSTSTPPNCVGAPMTLVGLDDTFVRLESGPDGRQWSDRVTIEGVKTARSLEIESLVHS